MSALIDRLNKVLTRLTSDELLSGKGLGNEIGFYIFDYSPKEELIVREHIAFLLEQIPKKRPSVRVKHINLFEMMLDYFQEEMVLDEAMELWREKADSIGPAAADEEVRKALAPFMHGSELVPVFRRFAEVSQYDLFITSGIGSVYPLLRTHHLLNNLHAVMGCKPLVMFFPGVYDGYSMRLFGTLTDDNYYRAFKLVP